MTDVFSPEKRSDVMRRVKGAGTGPERRVRKMLTSLGVRYRLHRKDLPGRPDIVMAGRRIAVFVHGCFWHGHDCARGARVPKQNRDYWTGKIGRNRARDEANRAALEALGWTPVDGLGMRAEGRGGAEGAARGAGQAARLTIRLSVAEAASPPPPALPLRGGGTTSVCCPITVRPPSG